MPRLPDTRAAGRARRLTNSGARRWRDPAGWRRAGVAIQENPLGTEHSSGFYRPPKKFSVSRAPICHVMQSGRLGFQQFGLGCEAIGGVVESVPARDVLQFPATLRGIEFQRPPELGLAFRAELQRLAIPLGGMVRAVHAALIGDAMTDTEHVAGLVGGCHDGAH